MSPRAASLPCIPRYSYLTLVPLVAQCVSAAEWLLPPATGVRAAFDRRGACRPQLSSVPRLRPRPVAPHSPGPGRTWRWGRGRPGLIVQKLWAIVGSLSVSLSLCLSLSLALSGSLSGSLSLCACVQDVSVHANYAAALLARSEIECELFGFLTYDRKVARVDFGAIARGICSSWPARASWAFSRHSGRRCRRRT